MENGMTRSDVALPAEAALRVDAICNRFEVAWQAGRRPSIEEHLGETPESSRSEIVSCRAC
jgi:hypothetical protein